MIDLNTLHHIFNFKISNVHKGTWGEIEFETGNVSRHHIEKLKQSFIQIVDFCGTPRLGQVKVTAISDRDYDLYIQANDKLEEGARS